MRILIADDDAISRKLMESMLERFGYEVVVAENGRDALDKLLKPDGPRLALVDWMMPEIDGPQLCRHLRAKSEQAYVYVVLLTSKDSTEDMVEGLDAGADEYLTKPCHSEELKARLRTGERILQLEDNLVSAREEMRFKATHDALTSLWNRGKVLEALEGALKRGDAMGVLMCDIDHFKDINDKYGHLVGDAVLREFSKRLRNGIRAYDLIGRYGGEEFLIVLVGCTAEVLPARAERMRKTVSQNSFSTDAGEIFFTASIGAVAVEKNDFHATTESILHLADSALYQAKREGRDRVVVEGRMAWNTLPSWK